MPRPIPIFVPQLLTPVTKEVLRLETWIWFLQISKIIYLSKKYQKWVISPPSRDHLNLKIDLQTCPNYLEMCSKIIAILLYSNEIEIVWRLSSKIHQTALGMVYNASNQKNGHHFAKSFLHFYITKDSFTLKDYNTKCIL